MSKRINVAALQSLVADLAEAVESVLTDAENNCLPLAPLTEAVRSTAAGHLLDAEEQRVVEAALRLDPALSSEEESRIRKDAAEGLIGAFVRLSSDLETARKRGIGFAGERSAPKVKQPGVRREAQKKKGRIELIKGLLAAGVKVGDELLAEVLAYDAEVAKKKAS